MATNIRNGFFDDLKALQTFYSKHEDHIKVINVQQTAAGKYILFYLAA